MKPLIYVAHPVTGDPLNNAKRATEWIRFFTLFDPNRLYIAPWVAEVLGFGKEKLPDWFYQRVLDDDCEVVARGDGLIAVGGLWTPGMKQERAVAKVLGKPIVDLTRFTEPSDIVEHSLRMSRALSPLPGETGVSQTDMFQ